MASTRGMAGIAIGAALALAAGLAQPSDAHAQDYSTIEEGTLLIGSDMTYPPYIYMDEGEPAGFEVEFMNSVAAHMGLEPQYVDTRFAQLIVGIRSNRFDVIASLLYITPERAEVIDFVPHTQTGSSILTAIDFPEDPKGPNDLCGLRVSSIQGASWIPKLEQVSQDHCAANDLGPIDIREFATSPEATQAVRAGTVEAQFEDAAVAQLAVESTGDVLKITSEELIYPIPVGLGVNSANPELKAALAAAIESMQESGEYEEILARYNLGPPDQEAVEAALSED